MKSDFRDAQVGDKCWCIPCGDCTIIEIDNTTIYSIIVKNDVGDHWNFTKLGKLHHSHICPSLFYSKPDCLKFTVKKTVELKGYYNTDRGVFVPSQTEPIPDKCYVPANATITFEEKI